MFLEGKLQRAQLSAAVGSFTSVLKAYASVKKASGWGANARGMLQKAGLLLGEGWGGVLLGEGWGGLLLGEGWGGLLLGDRRGGLLLGEGWGGLLLGEGWGGLLLGEGWGELLLGDRWGGLLLGEGWGELLLGEGRGGLLLGVVWTKYTLLLCTFLPPSLFKALQDDGVLSEIIARREVYLFSSVKLLTEVTLQLIRYVFMRTCTHAQILRNAYIFRFHRCLYETWQPGTSQHLSTALKNLSAEYHPFEVESIMGKRERELLLSLCEG